MSSAGPHELCPQGLSQSEAEDTAFSICMSAKTEIRPTPGTQLIQELVSQASFAFTGGIRLIVELTLAKYCLGFALLTKNGNSLARLRLPKHVAV